MAHTFFVCSCVCVLLIPFTSHRHFRVSQHDVCSLALSASAMRRRCVLDCTIASLPPLPPPPTSTTLSPTFFPPYLSSGMRG
ncbi:hypothetical protein F4775DRAFT_394464 [Biscogniauxia sp. FL1348]|nr:hypothetical protein F4775DRAFT_394464 [Biscogniauxia sp. FL1348]